MIKAAILNSIQEFVMIFPFFLGVSMLPFYTITKCMNIFHMHSNLPGCVAQSSWDAIALEIICQVLVSKLQIQEDHDAIIMFCTWFIPCFCYREGNSWNLISAVEAVHLLMKLPACGN